MPKDAKWIRATICRAHFRGDVFLNLRYHQVEFTHEPGSMKREDRHEDSGAPTRIAGTESAYLNRALSFELRAARELGKPDVTPVEVAACAIAARLNWSKANWRQIKAALVFRFTAMNTPLSLEAVSMLKDSPQTECLPKASSTSAQRLKSFSEEDLQEVVSAINLTRSRYASFLERWLVLGSTFGLRPHEWIQARLVWLKPTDAAAAEAHERAAPLDSSGLPGQPWDLSLAAGREPTHDELDKPAKPPTPQPFDLFATTEELAGLKSRRPGARPTAHPLPDHDEPCWHLRVRNAKNSNGRAHGRFRHLDASACSLELLRDVASFIELMRSVYDSGLYPTYYGACQRLLLRVNERLGKKADKHVQLYSSRHKFASVIKTRFSRSEVAALMGHATDETAGAHYGRRQSGAGGSAVRPLQSEAGRVHARAKIYSSRFENQVSKRKGPVKS